MTLFQGQDRNGASVNFSADGDNTNGLVVAVAITPKVPTVLGFEKRTISTSAIGITATSIPAGATHALVTLEGGDCRFREDASAVSVTGTDGLLMTDGQPYELMNLSALRFIRASYETADVTLQISYRKYN